MDRQNNGISTNQSMDEIIKKKIDDISVTKCDIEVLRKMAIEYIKLYGHSYQYDYFTGTADEQAIHKWMVNHVRHNMTQYDFTLYSIAGEKCTEEIYRTYKKAVLEKIAEIYPELKNECYRQMYVRQSKSVYSEH